MADRIFVMDGNGNLEAMNEEAFSTEDALQELIANHPELLAGEQMRPDNPRRWILITREKGIAETVDTGHRWSIDHVYIDQDAVPTLVEAKRGSNTEIRRTIVGQLLEYAAHSTLTWGVEELRSIFERLNPDHVALISQLLDTNEEVDEDVFWSDVETNLNARNLRLLFVADEIPDSLARTVEFLNAQMPRIEVLAVEIKQFKGKTNRTLVPNVIGRTAKPSVSSSPRRPSRRLTRYQFLLQFDDVQVRNATEQLLNVANSAGASTYLGTRGVSIRARCPLHDQDITVAWIFPPSLGGWMSVRDFSFGAGNGNSNRGPFGMEMRPELENMLHKWCNQFKEDAFTDDASSEGVIAYRVNPEQAVNHLDLLETRLATVIDDLANLKTPGTT